MRRQVLWSAARRLHQGVLAVVLAVAGLAVAAPPSSAHVPHDDIVQVVFSPDFATDRTVFAISRNRLMRSTNSGASWHQIVNGIDRHKPARIAVAEPAVRA